MSDAFVPERLAGGKKEETRALWEEAFYEDSPEFLDYYDQYKMIENVCYGIRGEEGLVSMLQLNPYRISWDGTVTDSAYIIAVATRKKYRHRGFMTALLRKSLGDMRAEGMPFVYLMPAKKEIYLPSGFRFFMETRVMELSDEELPARLPEGLCVKNASEQDIPAMVSFAGKLLPELYEIYTVRDEAYYRTLLAELACENGELFLIFRDGELIAEIPVWGSPETEVREILCRPEDGNAVLESLAARLGGAADIVGATWETGRKRPVIMGRIVCVESFLKLCKGWAPGKYVFRLTDELLPENEGIYEWTVPEEAGDAVSEVRRLSEDSALTEAVIETLSVSELFLRMTEQKKVCINEIV